MESKLEDNFPHFQQTAGTLIWRSGCCINQPSWYGAAW